MGTQRAKPIVCPPVCTSCVWVFAAAREEEEEEDDDDDDDDDDDKHHVQSWPAAAVPLIFQDCLRGAML